MYPPSRLALVLTCSAAFTAGCGGATDLELVPAGGTVTYKGAPLPNATVSFLPEKGTLAMAVTDDQGRFTLKTGTEDGASAAKYKVTVYAVEGGSQSTFEADPADPTAYTAAYEQSMQQQEQNPPKLIVPKKYTDVLLTPLSYEIKKGEANQFPIELTD